MSTIYVSILVFLDSLLQRRIQVDAECVETMFQSLFFWIHFYNAPQRRDCRTGEEVSILVFLDSLLQHWDHQDGPVRVFMFQSLFFWIHFYNRGIGETVRCALPMFQSLFFWIHFYNQPMKPVVAARRREFQSLFFWIHFYNGAQPRQRGQLHAVSILVFLDSLLQRDAAQYVVEGVSGFQSLFFWIHFYNTKSCACR